MRNRVQVELKVKSIHELCTSKLISSCTFNEIQATGQN